MAKITNGNPWDSINDKLFKVLLEEKCIVKFTWYRLFILFFYLDIICLFFGIFGLLFWNNIILLIVTSSLLIILLIIFYFVNSKRKDKKKIQTLKELLNDIKCDSHLKFDLLRTNLYMTSIKNDKNNMIGTAVFSTILIAIVSFFLSPTINSFIVVFQNDEINAETLNDLYESFKLLVVFIAFVAYTNIIVYSYRVLLPKEDVYYATQTLNILDKVSADTFLSTNPNYWANVNVGNSITW